MNRPLFTTCGRRPGAIRQLLSAWLLLLFSLPSVADLPSSIARVKPSVVGMGTYSPIRSPSSRLLGTGFIVGDGRHLVTCAHVIGAELKEKRHERLVAFVGTGAQPEMREIKVEAVDKKHDLAILSISGAPLPAVEMGDSTRVREGEMLAFTGFPIGAVLGLFPATHRGIVAAITPLVTPVGSSRTLSAKQIRQLDNPYKIFQLDATAYPGNSGSPLYLRDSASVIGVVSMVFVKDVKESVLEHPSGITYAIPSIYVIELMKKIGVNP